MFEVSRRDFESLVRDALDSLPPELGEAMDNIAVLVEDEPPEEDEPPGLVLVEDGLSEIVLVEDEHSKECVLGLYKGVPLTARGQYDWFLPDRIIIYRKPICSLCDSYDDVRREVTTTVVHEVAHHFGINDRTLQELGWG